MALIIIRIIRVLKKLMGHFEVSLSVQCYQSPGYAICTVSAASDESDRG